MPTKLFARSIIYCLVILFVWNDASADYSDGKARFCGKRLITTLEKLCTNGYWWQKVDQRPADSPYEYYAYQMKTSLAGVVNQCCLKSCSFEYLKSFCATDNGPETAPFRKAPLRKQPVAELPLSIEEEPMEHILDF